MLKRHTLKTTRDFHTQRAFEGQRVGVLNLGCARNVVDSQTILSNLKRQGHRIVDVDHCDVAFVNTCAFIDEAKQESIDTIIELLEAKRQGKIKKVIVAGCLAQRYSEELRKEFKDIDAIIGTQQLEKNAIPSNVSLSASHTAYVKISESCYNACSFCIIPKIKGKFVSRTVESVLEEVRQLDARGVKEINIIGQDITAYGIDLYRELSLAKLLKKMAGECRNIEWIRLLYAFPAHVTDELVETIAHQEKICKYIDIPLQHISDHILKAMNRNITTAQTKALVEKLRNQIPKGSLRTTFIVGLPGEREEDFSELIDFVKDIRFEKMGAFIYSREEGTSAFDMPNQVSDRLKKKRLDQLMEIQQEISRQIQDSYVGVTLKVLIDEVLDRKKGIYLGRSEYDAPDVDGIVYVHSAKTHRPGEFVQVKITDAYEYDLAGDVL